MLGRLASVPAFFGLRILSGLLLLKLSASFLPVSGFAAFSQFMSFAAFLNLVAIGGAQNGVIRQAAAAQDGAALERVRSAAVAIWAMVAPGLALAILLGSGLISRVLVGSSSAWMVVAAIAILALAAGPGQIACSILTGRKRVASSLAAQASGLVASTIMAAWLIRRGDPAAAAIGFASGPLVTMAVALLLAARLRLGPIAPRAARAEVRALLRYSAAMAATTGFSAILLFGLRSFYRETFDATQLGYWVAANRISDMSTQLLGLFMIQFFVPHYAMTESEPARRALILRCWAVGAAAMGAIPLVFSLGSGMLVHLFLSNAYRPAIPVIRAYMIGDFLRVWVSFAMYVAFARGRPDRYAGIEMGTLTIMAAIMVALIVAGDPAAPQIAYIGGYTVAALLATLGFLWRPAETVALRPVPHP